MSIIKELKRANCSVCKHDYNSCYIYARLYAFNVADMIDICKEHVRCKELVRNNSVETIQEECV